MPPISLSLVNISEPDAGEHSEEAGGAEHHPGRHVAPLSLGSVVDAVDTDFCTEATFSMYPTSPPKPITMSPGDTDGTASSAS